MSWKRTWKRRISKIKSGISFKKGKWNRAKVIKTLAILAFLGAFTLFFATFILFAWYAKDLPKPNKIVRHEGFATKIFDRDGELLYDVFADQRRVPVEIDEVPEDLRHATIAIEDKNFYEHSGFDLLGWVRALYRIVVYRRLEGGSTLTQQLVKNVLLSPKRTIGRKVKEFVLAVQIENKYTKDEILQMYLNEAPYGGTAWGVEAAAEMYFGKHVADLDLVESAILAGLPQRPSFYSPYSDHPDAWKGRTQHVLRRMREDGYVSKEKEEEALEKLDEVDFATPSQEMKAPHFVMYVKRQLEEKYGRRLIEQGGLKITTSLDWKLQEEAQEIVKTEIEKVEEPLHITNGAAMVMDPTTGEILSMVGSKDFFAEDYDGQVNVTLSKRQPGSSIKPITYVTAFKKGYNPATMIVDAETRFSGGTGGKDYVPKNYDGKFHGPVQVRQALGSSLNIPAVKMLAMTGLENVLQTAYEMGFDYLKPTDATMRRLGLSFTLGGGEVRLIDMASAYSTFANSGKKVSPVSILKVEDRQGNVLEEFKPIKGEQVLSPGEAYLITDILSDNNARLLTFGQNSLLNMPGRTVAVKTGTTDDMRDNWAIGWTPKFITAVWVGNNDNSTMKRVASGISGASPIWRQIMLAIFRENPVREFEVPDNVINQEVDVISGYPAHDDFPSRNEYFVKGTIPQGEDPIHKKMKICKSDNNKLAPKTLIEKGEYDEKEFIVLKENDSVSGDGKNRWQEGINSWIENQGDQRYHYPTEYCDADQELIVKIKDPDDKEKIDSNEVKVEAEVISNKSVDRLEIYVNDDKKETLRSRPYKTNFVLSEGTYEIKVKVYDSDGNKDESSVRIGVKKEWDWSPDPSPSPEPTPEPSPNPSPSPEPAEPSPSPEAAED